MSDIYLSIAVCTRNRASVLGECVSSILASCARLTRPWELVVVDNGSTDGTSDVLGGLCDDTHLRVVREGRLGVSYARNAAVANARGKVLAFIDDDVIVRDDWACNLCSEFETQGAEALGGLLLPRWEAPPPWWLTKQLHGALGLVECRDIVKERGYPRVYGGNLALARKTLAVLGETPFNPELGRKGTRLIGNEETYLIEQLWRRGVKIGFSENIVVWHRVPRRRMTMRWFFAWYFFWGVSNYREAGIRSGKRCLPRRVVVEMFLCWVYAAADLIAFRQARAVRRLFRFVECAGQMCEHVQSGFQRRRGG